MFKVPIDINENSMCYIEENSGTAELIRHCKLIVLDENKLTKKISDNRECKFELKII